MPGLTFIWAVGAWLYRALGRIDAFYGAATWSEALDWLATVQRNETVDRPIGEVQFWGHGNWGCAKIDGERFDIDILSAEDPRHEELVRVRDRMNPDGLWWFRTCETFGRPEGHLFAKAFADFLGVRVAGHTYVIHWAQSGLHSLAPSTAPDWPADEGVHANGRRKGLWSTFRSPNTISFLHGRIPSDW